MIDKWISLAALAVVAFAAPNNAAAAAPEGCKLIKLADWPIRQDSYKPVVDGEINGQKVGILLDTGATSSLVLRSAAVRLNLTRLQNRSSRAFAIGGESYVESTVIDEFRIGRITRKNWHVLVVGERDRDDDVAFLLGQDFLQSFDVEFDLAHNVVKLFEPRGCDNVPLAYWSTDGTVEMPIEVDRQIALDVEVNGKKMRAILDSAAVSVLTVAAAAAVGVTREMPGVVPAGCYAGLGGKTSELWIGTFDSVAIGNETVRKPKLYVTDLWKDTTYTETGSRLSQRLGDRPEMLLGAEFLRSHRVLISHSQSKMYFSYVGGTVFPTRTAKPCGSQ